MGLSYKLLGYLPSMPVLLGVPVLMFMFNLLGYNLRHSHIWLRWPGKWAMIFGSPAHHQIHHSCHPDHIDKNFAFMFPSGMYCSKPTKCHKQTKMCILASAKQNPIFTPPAWRCICCRLSLHSHRLLNI